MELRLGLKQEQLPHSVLLELHLFWRATGAADTRAKAVAELSCAFLCCLGSVVESALCSWIPMVKAGQRAALLKSFSNRCVHEGSAKPWEMPGATGLLLPRIF